MRLLISLILIFVACRLAFGQLATWTNVDLEEVKNDKEILARRDYGARYVIEKGVDLGKLPSTKLKISQTFRVATSLERGVNYKFDVELSDRKGNKYRIIYVVSYRSWDDIIKVTSYSFKPLPDGTEDATFKKYIDPENVACDPYVASLIEFGIQYMASNPVPSGPDASYRLKRIIVVQHTRGNPFRLWFLLELESETGPDITLEIEFFDDPWLEQLRVNYFIVHDVLYVYDKNLEKVDLDLPRSLTPEEYENNKFDIQDRFKFAIEASIAEGVKKGIFKTKAYTLANIWNASIDRVKGDNYYRFSSTAQMEGVGLLVIIPIVKNCDELFATRVSVIRLP